MDTAPAFRLDVVSDTICPWCWIGKRRLEAALARLGDDLDLELRWRPFELNPDMPPEGISRRDYRTGKFGSWERSLALDAEVARAGAGDGLEFRHARQERTPNTLASHALVRLAGIGAAHPADPFPRDVQSRTVEALFAAYFTEGRDVGDAAELVRIGTAVGLDPGAAASAVADPAGLAALHAEAQAHARGGIGGVPSVLLEGFLLFSGAQSPAAIEAVLREAAAHADVLAAREARLAA